MAQKYIIGDLVKYKVGGLEFIAEITNTSKYGYCFKAVSDDISGTLCKEFAKDIPLTTEILEKNGWVKEVMIRGVSNSHCVYTKPDIEEYGYFPIYIEKGIGYKKIKALQKDCGYSYKEEVNDFLKESRNGGTELKLKE